MIESEQLRNITDGLRKGLFKDERSVSQGIVLRVLSLLGWNIFDTSIVTPEYSLDNRRVDFALCYPANYPSIFIEVKKVGLSEGADRQLFEYAFHKGIPIAILTDGQEWSFYLPGEQGEYSERRVYKLDLLERDFDESIERLERYLNYQNVISGKALKSARDDYQNVARKRIIEDTLIKGWCSLLQNQDSLLLDLLADEVEDLCGYRPSLELCSQFIKKALVVNKNLDIKTNQQQLGNHSNKSKIKDNAKEKTPRKIENKPNTGQFYFKYKGVDYREQYAVHLMIKLFKILANNDQSFLERFAARKHGRKRRYLSQNKYDLYPDRSDLADSESVEIVNGWWLGTNYGRPNIKKIIDLAIEVSGEKLEHLNLGLDVSFD